MPRCITPAMKFSLAFLVALALSGSVSIHASPVRNSNELSEVLQEFLDLVPKEKVLEITLEYLEHDAEVQAAVEYVQTEEFKDLVRKVESIEDVINFYDYLHEAGLDIYGLVNKIHEFIGLPPLIPERYARKVRITGGVAGFIADIKAVIPVDKIKALYLEKLETSPAFANLIERLSSPRFQELIDALRANEEFQKIVKFAKEAGVDIEHIKDLLASIFGIEFTSRKTRATQNLDDDLNDFLAILPVDQITEIALDYLENDPEIQETVEYLQTDAFHQLVQEVEAMKEAKDVLAFLQDAGLDAYGFLNSIHEILGIPPFKPSYLNKRSFSKAKGGLSGLIADIKAILPNDEIKALYYHKLENSVAFANLIKRLSSQEFQDFVDAVLEKDEARVILQKLKDHGIDLEVIVEFLETILGLHFPKPVVARVNDQLVQDLQDFLELVPLEEVIDISVDYVLNDPDVQKAAVYIRTEEFQKLATAAEQNKEFRAFIRYLDDSGLPASRFINNINVFLGIPEVDTSARRSMRAGGGVRGMLDAIEAVLPQEEIKALYEQKKKTSKAFAYMIERLESSEFQAIVDELAANEDFQNLGYQAASFGIDLQAIVDFLKKVFGIEIDGGLLPLSARSLEDDLKEFLALIPVEKVRSIVAKYVLLDKEVKEAVRYIRSPEFAQLISDLNDIPEYHDLLKSLEEAGLDVYAYIEEIHKILGIAAKLHSKHARATGGIAGMIEELKAVLPVDEIKALYNKKLETSEDFVGLVALISSDKFQAVTDALFANKIFQDILHKLQSHGIDLQVIADFFFRIFGITTPPGIIGFRFRF